jgi:hypothetical protein
MTRRWRAVTGVLHLALAGCGPVARPDPPFELGRPELGEALARGENAALAVGLRHQPPPDGTVTTVAFVFQRYDPQTQTLIPNTPTRYGRDSEYRITIDRCSRPNGCAGIETAITIPAGDYVMKAIIAIDDTTRPRTGKAISLIASERDDNPFHRATRQIPRIGGFDGGLRYHIAAGDAVHIGEFIIDFVSSPPVIKEIVRNEARAERAASSRLVFQPPNDQTGRSIPIRE